MYKIKIHLLVSGGRKVDVTVSSDVSVWMGNRGNSKTLKETRDECPNDVAMN